MLVTRKLKEQIQQIIVHSTMATAMGLHINQKWTCITDPSPAYMHITIDFYYRIEDVSQTKGSRVEAKVLKHLARTWLSQSPV